MLFFSGAPAAVLLDTAMIPGCFFGSIPLQAHGHARLDRTRSMIESDRGPGTGGYTIDSRRMSNTSASASSRRDSNFSSPFSAMYRDSASEIGMAHSQVTFFVANSNV